MLRHLGFISISLLSIACSNFGKFWEGRPQDSKSSGSGSVDTMPPTTPTGWSATQGGSTQITLNWSASTDDMTMQSGIVYEICQSTTAGICATFAVTFTTGAGVINFNATGLSPSTTYYYQIRAKDAAGNVSLPAAETSATTAAPGVVNNPGATPSGSTYNSAQNVVWSTSTGGAIICHTNDSSNPACDAPKTGCVAPAVLYTAPVNVAVDTTLKAIACLSGNTDSSITTHNYVIDTVAPTVTNVTASTANGTYGTGQAISIQVTFSEVVNATGTPQLMLATTSPATSPANYVSGAGTNTLTFTYTVGAGNASADLDYASTTALVFNGGAINDNAGNMANLTLAAPGAAGSLGANKAIVIDANAPTVTLVTSASANGSYQASTAVSIQITFSEVVNVTGTPQLTLATGSPATTAVNYVSGSGTATLTFNYLVVAGNFSADLDYFDTNSLSFNGGTIRDAALNNASLVLPAVGGASSLGGTKNIVIDTSQPTITNVTAANADATYAPGQVLNIQVQFSETVYVGGTPQLTLSTGAPATTAISYASGSGSNTLIFNYTVAAGNNSADLDYANAAALSLAGGSIQDGAGNAAVLTLAAPGAAGSLGANKAIVVDGVAPTVINVTSSSADGVYGVGQPLVIQVVFSEIVTVTGTPTLALATGTPPSTAVGYVSGTGSNTLSFTYIVAAGNASADLDYTGTTALVLAGGTINDAVANAAVLTLAVPGAAGSLGANKNLTIGSANTGTAVWAQTASAGVNASVFNAVSADTSGNIYAVGSQFGNGTYTYGSQNATGTYASGTNSVIVKYDSSGTVVWARTTSTGVNASVFNGVATDGSGNVYAVGAQFGNGVYSYGSGGATGSYASGNNAVIVKFNASGTVLSTLSVSAGSNISVFQGVSVDTSGNVYAVGYQMGTTAYTYGGQNATGSSTSGNVVIVKYDNAGTAMWARTSTAGTGGGTFLGVACDSAGDVYAAGSQTGTGMMTYGTPTATGTNVGNNSVLVKYNAAGTAQWARTVSAGANASQFYGVTVDGGGNPYVAGHQTGTGTYTYGTQNATGTGGAANVVLVKYNSAGTATWARTLTSGGTTSEFFAVKSDSAGNIYTAGYQNGTGAYNYGGQSATGTHTGQNVSLVRYDSSGTPQWARSVSAGTNNSRFYGVAIDPSGSVYAAGFQANNGAYTYGSQNATGVYASGNNAVLVKYQ